MKQSNGFIQEPMATEVLDNVQEKKEVEANNVPIGPPSSEMSLAIKPKTGVPVFKLCAIYKTRLKMCLFLHFLLFLVMMAKLSEDILDRMDIFILQLEELYIPKPIVPFEYGWTLTIIFSFVALRALSRNLGSLKTYAAGTVVFGICPLLGVVVYFFNDVLEYAEKKDEANVEKWQNFPVALYYYGFVLVALQVHIFSLYFSAKLLKLWRSKAKRF